jgi:hypothetical protein
MKTRMALIEQSIAEYLEQLDRMDRCETPSSPRRTDLVRPLEKRLRVRYEQVLLGTKGFEDRSAEGRRARDIRRAESPRAAGVRSRARGRMPCAERPPHQRRVMWLIDAGYNTLLFVLMALVIAHWPSL